MDEEVKKRSTQKGRKNIEKNFDAKCIQKIKHKINAC